MQPLHIVIFVLGALPIAVFLLTLYLTDGAPLRPFPSGQLSSGEERGSAAAVRILPQEDQERRSGLAAAGPAGRAPAPVGGTRDDGVLIDDDREFPTAIIHRDAELFLKLFGAPYAPAEDGR